MYCYLTARHSFRNSDYSFRFSQKLSLCLSSHPQKVCTFLQTPHPKANSSPVGGWSSRPKGQVPSSWVALGPTGHWGRESLLSPRNRTKSSWHGVQKWVVPKQKYTATEQQYLAITEHVRAGEWWRAKFTLTDRSWIFIISSYLIVFCLASVITTELHVLQ